MEKKKILMVCEAFGGGVFTYVSQLCNDMVDDFEVYLAYSLRPQTPKNYKEFLNQKVHLIKMKHISHMGLCCICYFSGKYSLHFFNKIKSSCYYLGIGSINFDSRKFWKIKNTKKNKKCNIILFNSRYWYLFSD